MKCKFASSEGTDEILVTEKTHLSSWKAFQKNVVKLFYGVSMFLSTQNLLYNSEVYIRRFQQSS